MAGGAGERFWPASRRDRPKPLLDVMGGQSLLEATLARARRFVRNDRVWVVCGVEHARAVRKASQLSANRLLVEPRRRNTAMAIAWSAQRIAAVDPDAVMAVLPADHHIPDERAFAADMRRAADAAARASVLVTFGVRPTRPDTGYGYIQSASPAGRGFPGLRRVKRFVEKPDPRRARQYLRKGDYRWNSGIFVWSVQTLLEEIEACCPELHRALGPIRRAGGRKTRAPVEDSYRRAPGLPIDVAVMERSRRVWTLPVNWHWSDVGTWARLAEELGVGGSRSGRSANHVVSGDAVFESARANLVWGGKRLVALLDVEDLAVIDTDDVILVTKLSGSSDVRRVVAALKARGDWNLT
jgi:mannose-1-phosphate guanylyltransferase